MSENASTSVPEEVNRCLSLFRNAATDNERFASLLLIAKLMKSRDTDQITRKKIFDGIGFNFLNRLLATEQSKDEAKEGLGGQHFHQVAVVVLACFCTDPQLVLHPQVTSKIPYFNTFISSSLSSHGLLQDSLQCFGSLVSTDKGCEYLWKHNSISALFECFKMHNEVQQLTKDIIHHLVSYKELTLTHTVKLTLALTELSQYFKQTHEKVKFDICQLFTEILSICGECLVFSEQQQWLTNIGIGLRDILQNKLDSSHRDTGLILSGLLCQHYGSDWILLVPIRKDEITSSFLLLMTHLACIEVQLIDSENIKPVIISCFAIMESVIILMANHDSKQDAVITEECLLQLHTTLMEGFAALINFFKTHQQILNEPSQMVQKDYLISAVRVLGAWLAEDSLSLNTEIYSLIPFFLRLCEQEVMDVLKFLLPGFSHLVTDEKPRDILLKNGFLVVLLKYIRDLNKRIEDKDNQQQISFCCSVILALCLSDLSVIRENHQIWNEIAAELAMTLNSPSCKGAVEVCLQCSLLWLIIIRNQGESANMSQDIMGSILLVLSTTLNTVLFSDDPRSQSGPLSWESVSELWHIAMQELNSLISQSADFKMVVSISPALTDFNKYLGELLRKKVVSTITTSEEQEAIATSICTLYKTLGVNPQ